MFKQYDLLAKKESMDNLDLFLREYDDFDEIPLISRTSHSKIIRSLFSESLTQESLINLSVFYINNIYLHAESKLKKDQFSEFFACLTFDLSDIDFWGFYVPNILVSRKISLFKFILELNENRIFEGKENSLFSSFVNLSLENSFVFCRAKDDDSSSIARQYAIPNFHFRRLKLA